MGEVGGATCVMRNSRNRATRWLDGFALGVLVGSLFLIVLFWASENSASELISSNFVQFATILSSIFAAWLALRGIRAQVETSWEQERARRGASLAAAKASLPLALSQLHGIAKRGAEVNLRLQNGKDCSRIAEELQLPHEAISVLKQNIEYASEVNAQRISALIRNYQILNSRTIEWVNENRETEAFNLEGALDWVVLLRMIGNCFEYARDQSDEVSDNLENLNLAGFFIVQLGVDESDRDGLHEAIIRREASLDPRPLD